MRSETSTRSRCWYAQATSLLGSIGIEIDRLPPYQFSLDAPAHLLPSRQVLNEHVRQDIYRQYITTTWCHPSSGLRPRRPSMLSIFLLFRMVLLFALPIFTDIGIMHYGFLWALLGLVLIALGLELTTIWIRLIDYASYALWWRLRPRFTSYFVVLFTMRS